MPRRRRRAAPPRRRRDRRVDGGRVERVVAGDDRVQQRGVQDGARARAGLVERGGERDQAVARDAAVRRLHADRAGDGGGLADRPAGVGADRERRLERRDRGGRAAARAAGDAGRGPTGCASGRRRECSVDEPMANSSMLVLPRIDDAGLAQARGDGRVVRRHPASRIFEPQVVGMPLVAKMSLSASGTPASGPSSLAAPRGVVDGRAAAERALGVDVQERVHLLVDGGDPVEVGLGDLDRADSRPRRWLRPSRPRSAG